MEILLVLSILVDTVRGMTATQESSKKNPALKVHRNFKLAPDVDRMLRKRADKSEQTQTKVVELAIRAFCSLKG